MIRGLLGVAWISKQSGWYLVDFCWSTIVPSECVGYVLEQNDNFMESDWSKKAYDGHDHPYSLLFWFYQLRIGSIVAPSESMKFPIFWEKIICDLWSADNFLLMIRNPDYFKVYDPWFRLYHDSNYLPTMVKLNWLRSLNLIYDL